MIDREKIKSIIKEWVQKVDKKDVIPSNISAINFGLYEPYGIELIGSITYDVDNDDWACNKDFVPTERSCPYLNINENVDWKEFLETIQSILKELTSELNGCSVFSVQHITTGFCDGDLSVVK